MKIAGTRARAHVATWMTTLALTMPGLPTALMGVGASAQGVARPAAGAVSSQPLVRFVPESVTVFAGLGSDASSDGTAAVNAQFQNLYEIALDSRGNLYTVDRALGLVRRVNASDGTIVTVAGTPPSTDGDESRRSVRAQTAKAQSLSGTDLILRGPRAVTVDSNDLVYFADTDNNVVYKLDATGAVTVVAGTSGSSGYSPDGSVAAGAMLSEPAGLVVDAAGNVYIADTGNNVVRRVSAADGTIVTVAGSASVPGGYGGDGGLATAALMYQPNGLALDLAGNLLIADTFNCVVRKVDAVTKNISTVVGNHTCGYAGDGGLAINAQEEGAYQIAVDAAGQIYVGGTSTGVVRKVDLNGYISSVAGFYDPSGSIGSTGFGGPSTQTVFEEVNGVAVDSQGSLYLVGEYGEGVFRIGPGALMNFGSVPRGVTATQTLTVENLGGASLAVSGLSLSGSGFAASPAASGGCSAGTMVAPGAHCGITVQFSPSSAGTYSATLTLFDNAAAQPQTIPINGVGTSPVSDTALSVSTSSATAGDAVTFTAVVTADSGTGPVPTGTVLFKDNNTGVTLAVGTLDSTGTAVVSTTAVPAGYYFVVANYQGDSVYAASASNGADLTIASKVATVTLTASPTTLTAGASVAATATISGMGTAPTGSVVFLLDGVATATTLLGGGSASASLSVPLPGAHTLQATYAGDSLYGSASSNPVALTAHGAVLQFTPGTAVTLAGTPSDDLHGGFGGDGGPATAAYLHTPYGVATDAAGNVYVADEENNVIRKVALDGTISTVVGIPYAASIYGTRFGGDGGPAVYAYLDHPTSVVVDASGNLYIADYSNNVVREVMAATGIIQTIAGNNAGGGAYNGDGVGTATLLFHPSALALDAAGNLYIADAGNNLVRRLSAAGTVTTVAGSYYLTPGGPVRSGVAATSTFLYSPGGVAADAAGNLYISDTTDNVIRKVDPSGTITTVGGGGNGVAGSDNVSALTVELYAPQQMAIDAAGNLYFAESGNGVVRRIDGSGLLTTPVGFPGSSTGSWSHFDPQGEPANDFQLVVPSGVAVAPDGSLVVSDTYNQTVIRSGAPGALLFGPQSPGASSPAQTVTLANVGDATLVFGSTPYTVSGDYAVSGGTTHACVFSAPLAAGGSCTMGVTYTNTTGSVNGAVSFSANVTGTPRLLLQTNATGTASTTSLSGISSTATVGDTLFLIASVTGQGPAASGSVFFYDGTVLIGSGVLSSGYASVYDTVTAGGTHSITARYLGDGFYAASTSAVASIVVSPGGTSTSLSASNGTLPSGSPLTLTAVVAASRGGTVSEGAVRFYDGTASIGTPSVDTSGVASLTLTALSAGAHAFTAVYQANADYSASTSNEQDVTVTGGAGGGTGSGIDYIIQALGLPVVLHLGDTGTVALSYIPQNNASGRVALSCGTLPSYATCSFSPASVAFSGGATQSVTLTITTTAASGSAAVRGGAIRMGGTSVAVIAP